MTPFFTTAHEAMEYLIRQVTPEPYAVHLMDYENLELKEDFVVNHYGLVVRVTVKYRIKEETYSAEAFYSNSDN